MRKPLYFIGIDLHKSIIQVCVMDEQGEVVHEQRFVGGTLADGEACLQTLLRWKEGGRYAVEAVGFNRWLVRGMRALGMAVVVVDPVKLGLRMSGKKTDRRDAYEIARRLRLGDLESNALTYYPTEEEYGRRKLLRTRHRLVQVRQKLTNQVRGMLNAYRVSAPAGSLTSRKNLNWLLQVVLPEELLTVCLRGLEQSLRSVQASIDTLSARIEQEASTDSMAVLQKTAEGVGAQTALTLVSELGDVVRFDGAREAAQYAGLAPRVANSADKSHHGRITKRGNPELRWIASEWAVRLMTRNVQVQKWAAPRLRRMHKNKVRIALARRLLIGVYFVLRHGVTFDLGRCLGNAV